LLAPEQEASLSYSGVQDNHVGEYELTGTQSVRPGGRCETVFLDCDINEVPDLVMVQSRERM
jgi:hypothetical protein